MVNKYKIIYYKKKKVNNKTGGALTTMANVSLATPLTTVPLVNAPTQQLTNNFASGFGDRIMKPKFVPENKNYRNPFLGSPKGKKITSKQNTGKYETKIITSPLEINTSPSPVTLNNNNFQNYLQQAEVSDENIRFVNLSNQVFSDQNIINNLNKLENEYEIVENLKKEGVLLTTENQIKIDEINNAVLNSSKDITNKYDEVFKNKSTYLTYLNNSDDTTQDKKTLIKLNNNLRENGLTEENFQAMIDKQIVVYNEDKSHFEKYNTILKRYFDKEKDVPIPFPLSYGQKKPKKNIFLNIKLLKFNNVINNEKFLLLSSNDLKNINDNKALIKFIDKDKNETSFNYSNEILGNKSYSDFIDNMAQEKKFVLIENNKQQQELINTHIERRLLQLLIGELKVKKYDNSKSQKVNVLNGNTTINVNDLINVLKSNKLLITNPPKDNITMTINWEIMRNQDNSLYPVPLTKDNIKENETVIYLNKHFEFLNNNFIFTGQNLEIKKYQPGRNFAKNLAKKILPINKYFKEGKKEEVMKKIRDDKFNITDMKTIKTYFDQIHENIIFDPNSNEFDTYLQIDEIDKLKVNFNATVKLNKTFKENGIDILQNSDISDNDKDLLDEFKNSTYKNINEFYTKNEVKGNEINFIEIIRKSNIEKFKLKNFIINEVNENFTSTEFSRVEYNLKNHSYFANFMEVYGLNPLVNNADINEYFYNSLNSIKTINIGNKFKYINKQFNVSIKNTNDYYNLLKDIKKYTDLPDIFIQIINKSLEYYDYLNEIFNDYENEKKNIFLLNFLVNPILLLIIIQKFKKIKPDLIINFDKKKDLDDEYNKIKEIINEEIINEYKTKYGNLINKKKEELQELSKKLNNLILFLKKNKNVDLEQLNKQINFLKVGGSNLELEKILDELETFKREVDEQIAQKIIQERNDKNKQKQERDYIKKKQKEVEKYFESLINKYKSDEDLKKMELDKLYELYKLLDELINNLNDKNVDLDEQKKKNGKLSPNCRI